MRQFTQIAEHSHLIKGKDLPKCGVLLIVKGQYVVITTENGVDYFAHLQWRGKPITAAISLANL